MSCHLSIHHLMPATPHHCWITVAVVPCRCRSPEERTCGHVVVRGGQPRGGRQDSSCHQRSCGARRSGHGRLATEPPHVLVSSLQLAEGLRALQGWICSKLLLWKCSRCTCCCEQALATQRYDVMLSARFRTLPSARCACISRADGLQCAMQVSLVRTAETQQPWARPLRSAAGSST